MFTADLPGPTISIPLTEVQGTFVSVSVIPLVVGSFSEANIDLVKILKILAKGAFNCD